MDIYFSDFFGVSSDTVKNYGAFDVSLVNDLPLFIDPFLIFNSDKPDYAKLHDQIIEYMLFLKALSEKGTIPKPLIDSLFTFPEVKQNWLGFSLTGNDGRGLGKDFAKALNSSLQGIFNDFGREKVSKSSHIEKLTLIRGGVGRDSISDFSTNLIKEFLCNFTQTFAQNHLQPQYRTTCAVPKCRFNYKTKTWAPLRFELPYVDDDYVLLTPRDILTKDETWINRKDMISSLQDIVEALPNDRLRAHLNEYLKEALPDREKAKQSEIDNVLASAAIKFPEILDHYIRSKEDDGARAISISSAKVFETESYYVNRIKDFVTKFLQPEGFYDLPFNTYEEAIARAIFLKDVIENKGGHKILYDNGRAIKNEKNLQVLYRLTWFATPSDISREVDDGRGPADFKASRGAKDKTIIEFKLASNTKLKRNLQKQTAVYEKASDSTHPSIKVIVHYTENELNKINRILKELNLQTDPGIILIDAYDANKLTGSNA